VRSPNYNKTTWRINRPGQQSTDYYFFSPGTTATNSTRPSATEQQEQEQEQQQEQVQLRGGGGGGGGGRIARVVALYREATGHAPMPPKAILGFTMSKDRYKSQAELLTAARGFRSGKKTNVFGAALFYTLTAPPPPVFGQTGSGQT
jgi:alpha-glucosidase (family GH31 glycosyl hydrolase)